MNASPRKAYAPKRGQIHKILIHKTRIRVWLDTVRETKTITEIPYLCERGIADSTVTKTYVSNYNSEWRGSRIPLNSIPIFRRFKNDTKLIHTSALGAIDSHHFIATIGHCKTKRKQKCECCVTETPTPKTLMLLYPKRWGCEYLEKSVACVHLRRRWLCW